MVTHLSRLENRDHVAEGILIKESFPNVQLLDITCDKPLWYADYVNFIASGVMPSDLTPDSKKKVSI